MKQIPKPPEPPPPPPKRIVRCYPFIGDIETKESKQARLDWYAKLEELEKEREQWKKDMEKFSQEIRKENNG